MSKETKKLIIAIIAGFLAKHHYSSVESVEELEETKIKEVF